MPRRPAQHSPGAPGLPELLGDRTPDDLSLDAEQRGPDARPESAATRGWLATWGLVGVLLALSFWLGARLGDGLPFGTGAPVQLTTWAPAPAAPDPSPNRPSPRAGAASAPRATARLGQAKGSSAGAVVVNVNLAGVDALRQALHLRRATAERIIAYRRRHGPYTNLSDLLATPLSRSTVERLAGHVRFR